MKAHCKQNVKAHPFQQLTSDTMIFIHSFTYTRRRNQSYLAAAV